MIEIQHEESGKFYNIIKNIVLSKKDKKSFMYKFHQHHLYEESEKPGISKHFYNEWGEVKFTNINGQVIKLEFDRWHPHQHNGYSGLNCNPCQNAKISIIQNNEEKVLWELKVGSGTLYFKAEVSSLEIPYDFLWEQQLQRLPFNAPKMLVMKAEKKVPETRILFDEIVNLHDKYKTSQQTYENLLCKRNKEIQLTTAKIVLSYDSEITKCNEDITAAEKELNDFDKLFEKYSTFDIDLIGKAIQQIMSVVENEEYMYEKVTHRYDRMMCSVMGDIWWTDDEDKAKIIVRKDKLEERYCSLYKRTNTINELVQDGFAIVLCEEHFLEKNITFYTSKDGVVSCHIDFGKFSYVKEFVCGLVQYRFQNHLVEINEKDILTFMKNFITEHKNMRDIYISKYYSNVKEKKLNLYDKTRFRW